MKAYWRVELQLHAFFDLGTRWKWVVGYTPRPLYPQGKSPWYPLDRKLGEPQSRSGRGGEEKIILKWILNGCDGVDYGGLYTR
jgi:hypothetical protein